MGDKTRTKGIRVRATKLLTYRLKRIVDLIRFTMSEDPLKINNFFEYNLPKIDDFVFFTDRQLIDNYVEWLIYHIRNELITPAEFSLGEVDNHIIASHLEQAYLSGVAKTQTSLKRDKNIERFITGANITNPHHYQRAEILHGRVFSLLENISEEMEIGIRQILTKGMLEGKATKVLSKEMVEKVDGIGKKRALLIANTEIVHAHQMGAVAEAKYLQEVTGRTVMMLWNTTLDGRARDHHVTRHDKLYSIEEVGALLGEPNCRCSVTGVTEEIYNLLRKNN